MKCPTTLHQYLFLGMWLLILSNNTLAQDRYALLIGNADYEEQALRNPENDVTGLAKVLKDVGFKVTVLKNASFKEMKKEVNRFSRQLKDNSIALFYYSGHGVQHDGENYLIPIGGMSHISTEDQLQYEAINAGYVLGAMKRSALKLLLLDACRNNPFKSFFRSPSKGLATMSGVEGSLIGYATAPGKVAADGKGKYSPYAKSLIRFIPQAGWPVERVLKQVRMSVRSETGNKQSPFFLSGVNGDFYFKRAVASEKPEPLSTLKPVVMSEKNYDFPVPKMKSIKGGTFQMGCSPQDNECYDDEKPRHTVTLDAFQIGQYEVTFEQYDYYCNQISSCKKPDDAGWGRGQRPVINVNWNDAQAYIQWLKQKTGERFRLCTEAEWEYAARAGTETKYSWGNKPSGQYANGGTKAAWDHYGVGDRWKDSYMPWPEDGYVIGTSPIGTFKPNPWGLYDMHGNVWEWVQDRYDEKYYGKSPKRNPAGPSDSSLEYRVLRGGSWFDVARGLRSGYRDSYTPDYRDVYYGFRLCLG